MKRIMMVLPLAVLLAYCSGPNNTQTTTDTDMDATNSVSATTTETTTDETASTDVSDVNTNTTTVSDNTATTIMEVNSTTNTTTDNSSISTTGTAPMDINDPMYRHFQKTNGQYWTWDMNYPGYDRPTAGSYNAAINGNWQLVMTPELVSAWRQDNSALLWRDYAADGRYIGSNTFLSASESFNNRTSGSTLNGSVSGNVDVNGSTGTTQGVSTEISGSTSLNGSMDVNSISYNAANGNLYQLPKFNLYLDNGSFTGYTGCNAISGRVQVTGSGLHFLNTTPSTNIDCMGGLDQNAFLDILRKVDSYAYVGDELQLLQGNQVLLKFKRSSTVDTSLQ